MEFDHVIVVEPAQIVEEAVQGQGLRELYVALTRPTTTLVVVHGRPLPPELRV
jgi:DNA helicase IV